MRPLLTVILLAATGCATLGAPPYTPLGPGPAGLLYTPPARYERIASDRLNTRLHVSGLSLSIEVEEVATQSAPAWVNFTGADGQVNRATQDWFAMQDDGDFGRFHRSIHRSSLFYDKARHVGAIELHYQRPFAKRAKERRFEDDFTTRTLLVETRLGYATIRLRALGYSKNEYDAIWEEILTHYAILTAAKMPL